ncbi:hypothetical protein F3J34_30360 [Klebsiella sp. Ap-873]|nr:hypothetical protein [Klebsiella sp. Ap-873]
MTDYSQMSDGEISVRLAYWLKPKYSAVINPIDETGAQLSWNWLNTVQTTGFFPLRVPEELFRALKKHKISISPSGKTVWQASHESGLQARHRNPLRAIAIVFLMMQDSSNANSI